MRGRQTGDPRDDLRVHRPERTTYPLRLLCRVRQISPSAFYDWIHRGQPVVCEDDLDDAHAANELLDAWVEHRRTYGARRLAAEIRDQQGRALEPQEGRPGLRQADAVCPPTGASAVQATSLTLTLCAASAGWSGIFVV